MLKWLILIAIVALLLFGAKAFKRGRAARRQSDVPSEMMVACGHCGVNLPLSDAIQAAGRYYCSEQHRIEDAR
jgi:uncharacterized protein